MKSRRLIVSPMLKSIEPDKVSWVSRSLQALWLATALGDLIARYQLPLRIFDVLAY
jgi:hypothetical protein